VRACVRALQTKPRADGQSVLAKLRFWPPSQSCQCTLLLQVYGKAKDDVFEDGIELSVCGPRDDGTSAPNQDTAGDGADRTVGGGATVADAWAAFGSDDDDAGDDADKADDAGEGNGDPVAAATAAVTSATPTSAVEHKRVKE
jgi:hypothetical protein